MRSFRRASTLLTALGISAVGFAQTRPIWIPRGPEVLDQVFFGLRVWQWLGLLVIAAVAFLLSFVGRALAIWAVKTRERLTHGTLTHAVRRPLRRSVTVLIFAWMFGSLVGELQLPTHAAAVTAKFLGAVQILGFVLLGCSIWEAISEEVAARTHGRSDRAEKLLVPLASKLVRALIVTVGALIAIAELTDVNIPALVTSLGIGGLVIALAAKDSIENVFGSITILFDMPFALGDWVRIDKVEGVVEEINLRSTRIRTFEDTVITLPNANLIRAAVENFGARRVRRQKLSIRLNADNTPKAIGEMTTALRKYLADADHVQHDRAIVALESVDDVALGLFIQCHFEAGTQQEEMRLRDALLQEVLLQRDRCHVLLAGESRGAQDARQGGTPIQ